MKLCYNVVFEKDEQMIDIHSHILPGLDDGARDIYDTLDMAVMAAESGVTAMIATPHCNLPGGYGAVFDEEYMEAYRYAAEAIRREQIPLKLYPGMEVFASPALPELLQDGKIMTLNESRYLLIEFDFEEDEQYAESILQQIQRMKAVPVIAHAERYEFVQDHPEIVRKWNKEGIFVQVNKGSYFGRFGRRAAETAWFLTDQYLVTAVASDAHGPDIRTPYMADVRRELFREYPEDYVRALLEDNPRCILEDRPMIRTKSTGRIMKE